VALDHLPTRDQIHLLPDFTDDHPMWMLLSACLLGVPCGVDGTFNTRCGRMPLSTTQSNQKGYP
jgi:hypothetical protein